MAHIQNVHITNDNAYVTNQEALGTAGDSTVRCQDEKYLQDMLVADIPCAYAPDLIDGLGPGHGSRGPAVREIPNTYDTDPGPFQVSQQPTEY